MGFRREHDDFKDELDEGADYVGEARRRLQAADLIPPINALCLIECVEVTTPHEITPELTQRIADTLGDIPHIIRQVPFTDDGRRPGVGYI